MESLQYLGIVRMDHMELAGMGLGPQLVLLVVVELDLKKKIKHLGVQICINMSYEDC
jgi:hypothetical protein